MQELGGDDALERLIHCLISPKFLPHVSWTGRGKGKERKFALGTCDQLINFIVVMMNKIDSSYNRKETISEITYVILKRAPSKFGKTKASNQNDSPGSVLDERDEATINTTGPNSTGSTASQSFPPHTHPSPSVPSQTSSSIDSTSMLTNGTANHMNEDFQKFTQQPYWNYYSPYYYHQ